MAEQALNTEVTETSAPVTEAPASTSAPAEPKSQRELRREARNDRGADRATRKALEQAVDKGGKVSSGTVEEPPKPWEAPAYAKAWSEQRRKALEAIATRDDLKDHWKELDGQLNDFNQWDSRRNWEIGQYRKRLEPVNDLLQEMDQHYTRQGMSIQQGMGQLWQTAKDLSTNPDETMARISTMVRPRNPQQVLQFLAQTWGQDLNQLVQSQPYVDPVIQREILSERQARQRLEQQVASQQQAERQRIFQATFDEISQFEQEKDASGALKRPYAGELGKEIGFLLQTGQARGRNLTEALENAYEMASRFHPKAQEERQKAAEKAAREAAARNTTDAEQARNAARNISSKANGREHRSHTMMDAIAQAEKSVYGKTR